MYNFPDPRGHFGQFGNWFVGDGLIRLLKQRQLFLSRQRFPQCIPAIDVQRSQRVGSGKQLQPQSIQPGTPREIVE